MCYKRNFLTHPLNDEQAQPNSIKNITGHYRIHPIYPIPSDSINQASHSSSFSANQSLILDITQNKIVNICPAIIFRFSVLQLNGTNTITNGNTIVRPSLAP